MLCSKPQFEKPAVQQMTAISMQQTVTPVQFSVVTKYLTEDPFNSDLIEKIIDLGKNVPVNNPNTPLFTMQMSRSDDLIVIELVKVLFEHIFDIKKFIITNWKSSAFKKEFPSTIERV